MIRRLVGSVIAILVLCGASALALQEKLSPLSDYQYKKDYAQYEAIKKQADVQKRCELLLSFVKEHPISRMLLYVATDYQECVKPQQGKDWAKVISMEEALLTLVPTEKTVQDAGIPVGVESFLKDQLQPTRKLVLSSIFAAYYQSQNWPKAAETLEQVYQLAPDKSMLPGLADTYLKFNADKYLAYGQKILAEFPIDQPQGYSTALQMAQEYMKKQDVHSAAELFSKVMDVYGDKAPAGVPEAQWNATRAAAYGVMAMDVYAKKDYPKAQELYQKVAKFDPKRDDAYYYIGMSKWQNKDSEGAMEPFAKCVVLNKTYAKRAQQYLEQIYKGRHNDSLEGLDKILEKAKADLGIS
jgi:tetratricopeptide (TPR) repeat protein